MAVSTVVVVPFTVKFPDNVRSAHVAVPVNAGAVNVNPAIVVFVDPDAIDVLPIVGAEYPAAVAAHVKPPAALDFAVNT